MLPFPVGMMKTASSGVTFAAGSAAFDETVFANPYVFTGMSFPNAAAGRVCGVAITNRTGAFPVTAVSIGATSCTEMVATAGSLNGFCAIWAAIVPAGTSLTVSATCGGATRFVAFSFTITGASSATPSSTATDDYNVASPYQVALTIPTGGVGVAVGHDDNDNVIVWTNATSSAGDFQQTMNSGSQISSLAHAIVPGSVTLVAGASGAGGTVAGAAWGP